MLSPSQLTVTAVKESSIRNIAGVCVTKPDFLIQLNESIQCLMTYGNWWATVIKGRICVYPPLCITWPRWVGTLLATNLGHHNRQIQNKWYDFMPLSAGDCNYNRCWNSNVTVVDDGISCVFNNIQCGTPMYVRAYPRVRADVGKTVTVYGIDAFGNEYMTRDSQTGEWSIGEVLTLGSPFTQTTAKLREVRRVSKDLTTAPVDLYAYNDDLDILHEMAHYEPSETEPRYRHTTVRGSRLGTCCSTDSTRQPQIDFLAKMQFIPVVLDSDIVQIDNLEALKLMFQSRRFSEAGDDQTAATKQALAIKELNRQLADKFPLNQIPVLIRPEGTAEPRFAGIGQMM